jgi:hypothetical protein
VGRLLNKVTVAVLADHRFPAGTLIASLVGRSELLTAVVSVVDVPLLVYPMGSSQRAQRTAPVADWRERLA